MSLEFKTMFQKSKRTGYFVLTMVVVTIIVFLSSAIPDLIRIYTPQPGSDVRPLTSPRRDGLYPIILKKLHMTAKTIFSNATIRGGSVVSNPRDGTTGSKINPPSEEDELSTNVEAEGFSSSHSVNIEDTVSVGLPGPEVNEKDKDPLVVIPKPTGDFPVKFIFRDNSSMWNGRSLDYTLPGVQRMRDQQYFFIQEAIQNGAINVTNLAQFSIEDMEPWELELYKKPPMMNVREAADEVYSRVYLLNTTQEFYVGETVAVRVDVYDGFGRPKKEGGDDVRAWLRDDSQSAGSPGAVVDMKNGSYLATLPVMFAGSLQVRISLTYPKEIIRMVNYVRNIMKGVRLNAGGFTSSFASETTICSPFPFIGGYREVCNLTSLNFGVSWYCGRPKNPILRCNHWTQIRDMDFPGPLPMTDAEREWDILYRSTQKHQLRLITNPEIVIKSLPSDVQIVNTSVSCNKLPLRRTWEDRSPLGYMMQNQWVPVACHLPQVDIPFANRCLQGKTLYLIGDSNLRHMMELMHIQKLCITYNQLVGLKNWHAPQLCLNHEYRYAIRWRTHAMPFHTNADHWAPRINQQSLSMSLDEIPETGNYIIFLHMYIHLTTHHYTVYKSRIKQMAKAVARLVKRNPRVKIAIRGPHVAFNEWSPVYGGDLLGQYYLKVLKEELKALYDHVYLFDFWDMSLVAENKLFHPLYYVTVEMLRVMLGHLCDA